MPIRTIRFPFTTQTPRQTVPVEMPSFSRALLLERVAELMCPLLTWPSRLRLLTSTVEGGSETTATKNRLEGLLKGGPGMSHMASPIRTASLKSTHPWRR